MGQFFEKQVYCEVARYNPTGAAGQGNRFPTLESYIQELTAEEESDVTVADMVDSNIYAVEIGSFSSQASRACGDR